MLLVSSFMLLQGVVPVDITVRWVGATFLVYLFNVGPSTTSTFNKSPATYQLKASFGVCNISVFIFNINKLSFFIFIFIFILIISRFF
jgi:hypothetical protein